MNETTSSIQTLRKNLDALKAQYLAYGGLYPLDIAHYVEQLTDEEINAIINAPTYLREVEQWPTENNVIFCLGSPNAQSLWAATKSADIVLILEKNPDFLVQFLASDDFSEIIGNSHLVVMSASNQRKSIHNIHLHQSFGMLLMILFSTKASLSWVQLGQSDTYELIKTRLSDAMNFRKNIAANSSQFDGNYQYDVNVISPECAIFKDIAETCEQLGLKVNYISVPDRPNKWTKELVEKYVQQLIDQPAQVVLVRNHTLLEEAGNYGLYFADHIPSQIICWWWDVPNVASHIDFKIDTLWPEKIHEIGFAEGLKSKLPVGNHMLPPAARTLFINHKPERNIEPIVSFVGQSRFPLIEQLLRDLPEVISFYDPLLGQMVSQAFSEYPDYQTLLVNVKSMYLQIINFLKQLNNYEQSVAYYLHYALDMLTTGVFRIASIEKLSNTELPLKVYGDDKWLDNKIVTETQFGGVLEIDNLPAHYSSSKVNLNLNFMQVSTTVNPKVMDICAAGGLVLTDFRTELETLFPEENLRPLYFSGIEELVDKTHSAFETNHDELTQSLRQFVHENHSMASRIKWIFSND